MKTVIIIIASNDNGFVSQVFNVRLRIFHSTLEADYLDYFLYFNVIYCEGILFSVCI